MVAVSIELQIVPNDAWIAEILASSSETVAGCKKEQCRYYSLHVTFHINIMACYNAKR